jgi:AAA+ ATPase superfamily predicted ATPase
MSFLDNFWNTFAAFQSDVLFIVAGQSGSFINDELLNTTGGLYNRKTGIIYLRPFSLFECDALLKSKGIEFEQLEVLKAYMTFGGIPFYFNLFIKGCSVAQNIDKLLFSYYASLKNEFNLLFDSSFSHNSSYIKIIELIANSDSGLSREEIIAKLNLSDSGTVSKQLKDLQDCGFIKNYSNFPNSTKKSIYQIIDNFCYFYIKNIKNQIINDQDFWQNIHDDDKYNTYREYAFQIVCYNHIEQIRQKLGILGVLTQSYNWRDSNQEVNLLLDRADRVIDLIEIKYTDKEYILNKEIYDYFYQKFLYFSRKIKVSRNAFHSVLIAPKGVLVNAYYNVLDYVITLNDLFKEVNYFWY